MTTHIVVALSGHGYGHLGQTAPVLNALCLSRRDIRLTIRTSLPKAKVAEKINLEFDYVQESLCVGLLNRRDLSVDCEASLDAYLSFHRGWPAKVALEARRLRELEADVVFSNVSYLMLAGAAEAGIPAVAMCSVNWRDVFEHYFGLDTPERFLIGEQMKRAYLSANYFFKPEPSLPMDWLGNRVITAPIAQLGNNRRDSLLQKLGLKPDTVLVVVSFGGIDLSLDGDQWPEREDVHVILPRSLYRGRVYTSCVDDLDFPYLDIQHSCDVLVAKPGYCSFVEAAYAGVAVLYVPREDWPESIFVTQWSRENARIERIDVQDIVDGGFIQKASEIARLKENCLEMPVGQDQIARHMTAWLDAPIRTQVGGENEKYGPSLFGPLTSENVAR